jgi:hypothetical protein
MRAVTLGTTSFGLLLATFVSSLHDTQLAPQMMHILSSQREHVMPGDGTAMDQIMGYFSGAIPIRVPALTRQKGAPVDAAGMSAVSICLEEAMENGRDYLVRRYVLPELNPGYRPRPDPASILFHYLNGDPLQPLDGFYSAVDIALPPSSDPQNISSYLLNVTVTRRGDVLEARFYYSPRHYTEADITGLIRALCTGVSRALPTSQRTAAVTRLEEEEA